MQSVHWSGLFAFDVNIAKVWIYPLRKICELFKSLFTYEKLLFVSMLPFGLFYSFVFFLQLFIAAVPQKHWCWVPELEHINKTLRHYLTAPGVAEGYEKWDKCHTYVVNWTEALLSGEPLTPPDPRTPTERCQNGWEFELTDIPYDTVVSERDWVCQHARNVPAAEVFFMSGTFLGGFLFGWIADHRGRLPALVGSNMIGCIGGIGTIFTHGFWDFSFCRFLVGMSYDHLFMMMYIIVIEYVGPGKRSFFANITTAVFYGCGCISLPFLALWMADWRKLLWLTSLPMLIVLIVPFILTESASWLLSKGQVTETVVAVAKVNKPLTKISETQMVDKEEQPPDPPPVVIESYKAVLKSPPLRNTIILMIFLFIAAAIVTCYISVFGGLVRMSENLGLDFFTVFSLTSVTEIPSGLFVALLLDRVGRRKMTAGTLIISSAMIASTMYFHNGIFVTIMALCARLFVKMTYLTIIQWVIELLPTHVRGFGCSTMHMLGNVAIAFAPYMSPPRGLWLLVPVLILLIITIIAITLAMALPETKRVKLPQTIEDGERNVIEYTPVRYYKREKLPEPIEEINYNKSSTNEALQLKPIYTKNKVPIESEIIKPDKETNRLEPENNDKDVQSIKTMSKLKGGISTLKTENINETIKANNKSIPKLNKVLSPPETDKEETEEDVKEETEEESDTPSTKTLHDAPGTLNFAVGL